MTTLPHAGHALLTQSESQIFEKLLSLPLFQGIGRSEFLEIMKRIRPSFQTFRRGRVLTEQDALCTELIFVVSGQVCVQRESDSHSYVLTEWMDQPFVVQPEALFGLRTRYTRKYTLWSNGEVLKIDKASVRDVLFNYPTFRINYLNLLSMHCQQSAHQLARALPESIDVRFVRFLMARSLRPAGRKELRIKMTQLGRELLVSRLTVSRMLHRLADAGLVEMGRGGIAVKSLDRLIQEVGAK